MKQYKVKIKNSEKSETIKAKSELEARVKFCENNNLIYRVYAGNLEVKDTTKQ